MAPMVVLAERKPEACEGLIRSLRSDGAQTVMTTSIPEMMEAVLERQPEVLLLDTALSNTAGETLIPVIHSIAPETRIVLHAEKSDPADGAAIEGGVFFYAAGGDESYVLAVLRAALKAKRRT